jgi:hypothetical protein
MSYDQNTLAQTSVLDITPNGSAGAMTHHSPRVDSRPRMISATVS